MAERLSPKQQVSVRFGVFLYILKEGSMDLIEKAVQLAKDYIQKQTDVDPSLFVVWSGMVLQNFKCLIATTIPRWTMIELTHDGDQNCWYIDTYRKIENRVIPDD